MVDYKSCFKRVKAIAVDGHVQMYLLKKTSSKNDEKKREILPVDVDREVKDLFTGNLIDKCDQILTNEDIVFNNFFSGGAEDHAIFVISKDMMSEIGTFDPIISQLQSKIHSKTIKSFDEKTLQKLQSYAICISKINIDTNCKETCIYFRIYLKGSKISTSKTFGLLQLKNGVFDKLDGDVFKCDDLIDGIFYESKPDDSNLTSIKLMFIKNVGNFEKIFSFDEFYKKETRNAFAILNSRDYIEIDEELFDKIINKISYIKRISKLNKNGVFESLNFDNIKQIHEEITQKCVLNLAINDDRICITDMQQLNDFFDICEHKFVKDIANDDTICRGNIGKELPKL